MLLSAVGRTVLGMRAQESSSGAAAALRRPLPHHPLAVPELPDSWGAWQVRRVPASPLGYVRVRSTEGRWVFDCHAHCRDARGGRPWLHTADTLASAVAWMLQREREITAFAARHDPEPDVWPQ